MGSTLLVCLRADDSGNLLDLFVDGSSVISASQSIALISIIMAGTSAGAATTALYWSAWSMYFSASDDLDESHYPEMRLLHPDSLGAYSDYVASGGGAAASGEWDDLASEGDPDDDTTWNAGGDGTKKETHNFTTHAMTNTTQGVVVMQLLRQDQSAKTVEHGPMIRSATSDTILSYGTEDIGETYVVREGVFHTEPSTGTWTQALIDGAQAGHRRVAGSDALNIRVTAMGVVVVALGTTNLAPADPPAVTSLPPVSPLRAMRHLVVR